MVALIKDVMWIESKIEGVPLASDGRNAQLRRLMLGLGKVKRLAIGDLVSGSKATIMIDC